MLGPATPEATGYSRFSSHNYPDRYIRHANYTARVDANVSPVLDSQFRVVPGLASSTGISLESINFPGYFLKRNASNKIVLEAYADTAAYKGDATFLSSPGWADSTKVSLQSYSQPGYYIRHYDYVLQLDAINASSSSTVKSDATFGRTNF
ncbi:AbfB domain-containing protein [Paenibacillus sp. OVF10]|nr:AbfB domain-containing protein [Paenibacillus sp. OVF10]